MNDRCDKNATKECNYCTAVKSGAGDQRSGNKMERMYRMIVLVKLRERMKENGPESEGLDDLYDMRVKQIDLREEERTEKNLLVM